jgi:PAS domain S-box-containing protein
MPHLSSSIRHYAVAIIAVFTALGLMLLLDPWLAMTQSPFLLFFGAIMVSSWYGGLKPGLVSTLLSTWLSIHFFIQPMRSLALSTPDSVRVLIFAIEGIMISVLCDTLKYTQWWAELNLKRFREREKTLQHETQTALAEIEERLRVALKNSPITVFNQDLDLRYTWIYNNPAIGLAPTDVIGKRDIDLLPSVTAETVTRLKQQVVETGIGIREEIHIPINSDAEDFYFDLTVEPLKDSEGKIIGLTCAAIDISKYKRSELALRKSESLLNALLAGSPMGLAFLDRDLHYVHINEALARINDLPIEQHLNRSLWEVLPKWAPVFAPILHQVMRTREPLLNQEIVGERQIGMQRHCLINYYPVCLPDGELLGVGVTAMDITPLKQVETALRNSESRFKRLVESNVVGCIFWEASGLVTDANDSFLKMVGYSRSDLQAGQVNWRALTPPDQIESSEKAIAQMQKTGSAFPLEKEYVRKDGSRVPVLLGGVMFEGSQDRGVSFVIDLTEQKRTEAEKVELLKREKAARAEAEAANRTKDEFLAVLSHELRTPLNPILGWARLLRQRQFDPVTQERALETIERNAKLQTQLIEDLLDVSRILRGKLSIQVSSVDLAATIEAALETVQLAAEAKSIQIHTILDPSVKQVAGDPNRLQQVIWNLLSNAVKFTPVGGQVEVQLEQVEPGSVGEKSSDPSTHALTHPYAQITVRDTGKGISPNFLPYVFDYFRQADGTTTRQTGGLGLGLAIARHLVELHGGIIRVESLGEGQGATFQVWLPLQNDTNRISHERTPTADFPLVVAENPIDGSKVLTGLKILVVEDDADTRSFLSFLLGQAGATVTVTSCVKEALDVLAQVQFDLLISDIGMPQFDGYTLIHQVRELEANPNQHIPAIALTAYAGEANQQQALAAGFQMHLAKPIEPSQLVQAIKQISRIGSAHPTLSPTENQDDF